MPFSRTPIEDAPAEDDDRQDARLARGNREGETMEWGGVQYRVAYDRLRTVTVTDMAYVDGLLLVAGASNEEFSSTFRRIPFPFNGNSQSNSLEIFHVSHGMYETASPIHTFVPYGSNTSVQASYTCTPIVHFSLGDLKSGTQAKGKTIAELGSGNTPLDMVSYRRDGEEYLLVYNSTHPLMKIACKDIDRQGPLTQPNEPIGPPVKVRVNPADWRYHCPTVGSRGPLTVEFDQPLDHALLEHSLWVHDAAGVALAGRDSIGPGERCWRFEPQSPWEEGRHLVIVDPRLEDLAGNSLIRVFDRDLTRAEDAPADGRHVAIEFRCAPVLHAGTGSSGDPQNITDPCAALRSSDRKSG